MLQLFSQDFLLVQQSVLLFDQHLHPRDGVLQGCRPRGGGDSLRQYISEAGEEIDVVLIIVVLFVIVDFQHSVRPSVVLHLNNDIDGRDNTMGGVERRQFKIIVLAHIVADRWLPSDEGTPLWRTRRRALDRSDDTGLPAVPGFDQKVVLRGAVPAHFGEWHIEAFGADPRRLRQDFQQIAFAKSKATKAGNRGLLAQKLTYFCGVAVHVATSGAAVSAGCSTWKPRGNGGNALLVATISATISRPRSRSAEL